MKLKLVLALAVMTFCSSFITNTDDKNFYPVSIDKTETNVIVIKFQEGNKEFKKTLCHMDVKGLYDLINARKFFLTLFKSTLKQLNTNKNVRNFLSQLDYPPSFLNFKINFFDKNYILPVDLKYIHAVHLNEGIITYYTYQTNQHQAVIMHQESYEDALKIILKS